MSGRICDTSRDIPARSAKSTGRGKSDTGSCLYKEDSSLENSFATFDYGNVVAGRDDMSVFRYYAMEKM